MPDDRPGQHSGVFEVLSRRWRLILACALIAGGAALAYSLIQEKTYEATASLLFRATSASAEEDPTRAAGTNENLVTLGDAEERTAEMLEGFTESEVSDAVEVTPVGVSNIVSITATDSDPEVAAELANAYGEAFIQSRREADTERLQSDREALEAEYAELDAELQRGPQGRALQRNIGEVKADEAEVDNAFEFASEADVPDSAAGPKVVVNTVLGLALGFLLGFAIALTAERLRGHRADR
jgi:succinoglycan biosynthesis transport protein ExoP